MEKNELKQFMWNVHLKIDKQDEQAYQEWLEKFKEGIYVKEAAYKINE